MARRGLKDRRLGLGRAGRTGSAPTRSARAESIRCAAVRLVPRLEGHGWVARPAVKIGLLVGVGVEGGVARSGKWRVLEGGGLDAWGPERPPVARPATSADRCAPGY